MLLKAFSQWVSSSINSRTWLISDSSQTCFHLIPLLQQPLLHLAGLQGPLYSSSSPNPPELIMVCKDQRQNWVLQLMKVLLRLKWELALGVVRRVKSEGSRKLEPSPPDKADSCLGRTLMVHVGSIEGLKYFTIVFSTRVWFLWFMQILEALAQGVPSLPLLLLALSSLRHLLPQEIWAPEISPW